MAVRRTGLGSKQRSRSRRAAQNASAARRARFGSKKPSPVKTKTSKVSATRARIQSVRSRRGASRVSSSKTTTRKTPTLRTPISSAKFLAVTKKRTSKKASPIFKTAKAKRPKPSSFKKASTTTLSKRRGSNRKISSSNRLAQSTIKAQQELSNRFGVATFTTRGGISTVPTLKSGGFGDIDVGRGGFSDFDAFAEKAIQKQAAIETNRRQKEGIELDTPIFVSDPGQPARRFDKETGGFDSGSSFDKITENLPLIGIAFVGLLVVMRVIKKI